MSGSGGDSPSSAAARLALLADQLVPPKKDLKDEEEGGGGIPLSGEQLASFLQDGYLVLRPPSSEVAEAIHEAIYAAAAKLAPGYGGRLGNNVFPEIPELGEVLNAPTLRGALGSVLRHHDGS